MSARSSDAAAADSEFSIGELSRRVALTARTIRYYEHIGLLSTVRRVEGGRRRYTEDDVRRLKFIKRLKVLGLTLEEMRELEDLYASHRSNDVVLPRLLAVLDRHLNRTQARIDELRILQQDIEAYRHHIEQKL